MSSKNASKSKQTAKATPAKGKPVSAKAPAKKAPVKSKETKGKGGKPVDKVVELFSSLLNDTLQDKNDVTSVLEALESNRKELAKCIPSALRVKRKKDPNHPKKYKTGYIFYCMEQREHLKKKNPDMSAVELTSLLGATWKKLSDKEKKKYISMSEEDKSRYEDEMKDYTPPSDDEADEKPKGRVKKERTGPKRPLSSYLCFCQEMRDQIREENPELSGKEVTSELGSRWRDLSAEDKAPYEEKAAADKARYESEKADGVVTPKEPKKAAAKKGAAKSKPESKAEPKGKAVPANAKSKTASAKPEAKGKSAFDLFCEDNLDDVQAENPSWTDKKVQAELKKMWDSADDSDKKDYELAAKPAAKGKAPLSKPEATPAKGKAASVAPTKGKAASAKPAPAKKVVKVESESESELELDDD